MKAITEFPSFTLTRAVQAMTALSAEGKSAEEVQTSLGEMFKYEGDKLKYFVNAIDVANKNSENLKRVLVLSLNEGEKVPAKSVKVDEFHYVPEFILASKPVQQNSSDRKGKGKGKGGRDGKKGSPWGLSPEEKAAKNKPQPQ